MALTQVSTGGIKDGQVHTADLADAQITAGKLHADALDRTYTLGADGSNHYTFTGEGLTGAVNDPTLYLTRGKTYRFVNGNSAGAHPFRIQTTVNGSAGTEYNTGVTNNGGAGGSTIIFEVPHEAPDVLYYQCTSHGSMGGIFYITGALADGGVTTAKLADGAVTAAKIASQTITADKIANNAVNTGEIVDGSITAAKIATNVITADKIASGAVNTGELADGGITTAKIANSQITNGKLAADAVTSAKIADDAVDNEHIANDAVRTLQIINNAVNDTKIADSAVTTAKLADDAVTIAKLADDAVGTTQIANNAVTDAKINGMAASKLTGALPAISGASLTNLPGGGKVTRIFEVKSTGTQTYWYYSQGSPWITTGTISNVSANSRFLIFGRFELRLATPHGSVNGQCYFSNSGGDVYGGGSDSTNQNSYRTTEFTAYDYASNTNDRSYSFYSSSNGSSSTYGAQVRNAYILVLELDLS